MFDDNGNPVKLGISDSAEFDYDITFPCECCGEESTHYLCHLCSKYTCSECASLRDDIKRMQDFFGDVTITAKERDSLRADVEFWKSHDKDADIVRESNRHLLEDNDILRSRLALADQLIRAYRDRAVWIPTDDAGAIGLAECAYSIKRTQEGDDT